jgi:glucosamine--fructose-6-phosphate aminotransferase (isomerizing)
MCGIIGYLGPRPVVPVLVDALQRLEYRGYDSAGIAVQQEESIEVLRAVGKLSSLVEKINGHEYPGECGIGHTRWATHGRPSVTNAHPHRDCTGRIVVVHNGIIENHHDLRRQLIRDGHEFTTETDTEVLAHLIEREMNGDGLEQAVRRALQSVHGVYGVVAMSADDSGKIVAVREGPPLVIGVGDHEFFVASDIPPILQYTRNIAFLEDGEMAIIDNGGVSYFDRNGAPHQKDPQHVAWDPVQAEKGSYRHYMQKEMFEQPLAIRQTLSGNTSTVEGRPAVAELGIPVERLRAMKRVQIVACGTSWHSALLGKFLIEQSTRLPVEVDYASEYRYRQPIVDEHTLAIAVTQSGETADTLAALREARDRGATTLAICNVMGSMATREADGTLYTFAGPEIGVASTKAFTSQLTAFHLLTLHLAAIHETMSPAAVAKRLSHLMCLPTLIESALRCDADIQKVALKHYTQNTFLYLGRGMNYPIALEGALKLKEISYIHAEGYPAGEIKHGPIALIDEKVPVVAVVTRDLFPKVHSNLQEVKARGASLIVVSDVNRERLGGLLDPVEDSYIRIPAADPLLTPLLASIPLQLLAYHIAVCRGCDVDQPRNLAKSVTVE